MKHRNLIAAGLIMAILLSLLVGCTAEPNGQTAGESSGTTALPQAGEPVKLTIGLAANENVSDYETNAYTLWLEEQTGYDLEFVTWDPSAVGYGGLQRGEEELPDILWGYYIRADQWEDYGEEGLILDLAPWYQDAESSRAFRDRLAQLPQAQQDYIMAAITGENGGMYALPTVDLTQADSVDYQVYINRDWLDTLGLPMPTDIDSLYETLVAFRDQDPNGNGKKDELPLIGSSWVDGADVVNWIVNMFVCCDDSSRFCVDGDGQLYLPYATDEYRQALIFIHKLIDEGLMYPSAFSLNGKEIKGLLNPAEGDAVSVGIWAGDPEQLWEEGNEAIYAYEALPCWGYAVGSGVGVSTAVYITGDCENPDAAWNLLMTMCSEEGTRRMRYGVAGQDWTDTEGTSWTGSTVQVQILNKAAAAGEGNATWGAVYGVFVTGDALALREDPQRDPWTQYQVDLMAAGLACFREAEARTEGKLPQLVVNSPTEETACVSLINEAAGGFCTGTDRWKDPADDAQWADYLAQLEAAGYKEWMQAWQTAYDAR